MKIPVTIEKCDYCGALNVLINDYGECRNRCPGMFSTVVEKHFIDIPEEIVEEILQSKPTSCEFKEDK